MGRLYSEEPMLDFHDVMIRPKVSELNSRQHVDLNVLPEKTDSSSLCRLPHVPLIAANLDTIGTFSMCKSLSQHSIITCVHKHYTLEEWKDFYDSEGCIRNHAEFCIPSFGVRKEDLELCHDIFTFTQRDYRFSPKAICIDVANGYIPRVRDIIKEYRNLIPANTCIIVGNVATAEGSESLRRAGADIIKIGIGPGKFCKTRAKTGVGVPQFSAIREVVQCEYNKGCYIADGGCRSPGDVAKAFVAGASYVMLGSMLAGHDECGGTPFEQRVNGISQRVMLHYGMSSKIANEKFNGGLKGYRSAEGYESLIPYRGSVHDTIDDILGGLRSACTYSNAKNITELRDFADYVIVKTPHDNTI